MKFNWFVGIDVSKDTLDITVLNETGKIAFNKIENNEKHFKSFMKELKNQGVIISQALFCMEHTGISDCGWSKRHNHGESRSLFGICIRRGEPKPNKKDLKSDFSGLLAVGTTAG